MAPEVTSIIVDQSNRKSLLSFMVYIRQHLSNALTSRLSAFLPRTGTGKQGRAARFVPNPVLRESSGMQVPTWTGEFKSQDVLWSEAAKHHD